MSSVTELSCDILKGTGSNLNCFFFFCTILRHIKIKIKYQCGVRILLYGGTQQKKIIIQMDNRNSHTHQEQNQVILGISISYYLVPVQTGHSVVWHTHSYCVETITLDTSIQLDLCFLISFFISWLIFYNCFILHSHMYWLSVMMKT